MLRKHSASFRDAANEQEITVLWFRSIQPVTFEVFLDWMYWQELPSILSWPSRYTYNPDCLDRTFFPCKALVNLYIFADMYKIVKLKGVVFDRIIEYFNESVLVVPRYDTIYTAYTHYPQMSDEPLLQLLVDAYCRAYDGKMVEDEEGDFEILPHRFFVRTLAVYATRDIKGKLLDSRDYRDEEGQPLRKKQRA
jgi:hypothetical protein